MADEIKMEMEDLWQDFRKKVKRRRGFRCAGIVLAACALIAIPVGVGLDMQISTSEMNEILVCEGGDITLCDGTHVQLAEGSRLFYPERFEDGLRNVRLEGRAYFSVRSSPENPFIIDIAGGHIKVTGTKFMASSDAQNRIKVTLDEGRVELGKEGAEPVVMLPSEEIEYDTLTGEVKEATIAFKDERLEIVLKHIGDIYGFDYSIEDELLKDMKLLFRIPKYDDPSRIIRIIETVCDIHTVYDGGVLKVFSK